MKLEGGAYEWAQHIDVARRVGVTPAEIAAIEALRLDDPLFTTATRVCWLSGVRWSSTSVSRHQCSMPSGPISRNGNCRGDRRDRVL